MAPTSQRRTPRDKRRRFRRRLAAVLGYVLIVIAFAWYLESRLPTTVVFVRHTEVADDAGSDDPPLSAAGRARAESLADFVADIDVLSGVDAIYASEFRRTQETAGVVARRLDLEVQVANHAEVEDFMTAVEREHRGEIVLVVSHSNLIGPLIAELHGHQSVPAIAEDEFDNFYIVTIPLYGKVKTLRLHYGGGTGSAPPGGKVTAPL